MRSAYHERGDDTWADGLPVALHLDGRTGELVEQACRQAAAALPHTPGRHGAVTIVGFIGDAEALVSVADLIASERETRRGQRSWWQKRKERAERRAERKAKR